MSNENKIHTALITGASSGIGAAICRLFNDKGFKIIAVARNTKNLDQLKNTLPNPDLCTTISCDVSHKDNIKDLIGEIEGEIDVLINNAGVFIPGEIEGEEDNVYEKTMKTNIDSAYYMSKYLLPQLAQGSYIFNMCSTASTIGYPNGGSYCISKFAMLGLSKALRLELADRIAVSAVLPGATLTNSWAGTEEPESRFMQPEDVAQVIWSAWCIRKHTVVEEILMRPHLGDF